MTRWIFRVLSLIALILFSELFILHVFSKTSFDTLGTFLILTLLSATVLYLVSATVPRLYIRLAIAILLVIVAIPCIMFGLAIFLFDSSYLTQKESLFMFGCPSAGIFFLYVSRLLYLNWRGRITLIAPDTDSERIIGYSIYIVRSSLIVAIIAQVFVISFNIYMRWTYYKNICPSASGLHTGFHIYDLLHLLYCVPMSFYLPIAMSCNLISASHLDGLMIVILRYLICLAIYVPIIWFIMFKRGYLRYIAISISVLYLFVAGYHYYSIVSRGPAGYIDGYNDAKRDISNRVYRYAVNGFGLSDPSLVRSDYHTTSGLPANYVGGGCMVDKRSMDYIAGYDFVMDSYLSAYGLPQESQRGMLLADSEALYLLRNGFTMADGQSIAFDSNVSITNNGYQVTIVGDSNQRRSIYIPHSRDFHESIAVAFIPDGRLLIASKYDDSTRYNLWFYNVLVHSIGILQSRPLNDTALLDNR